MLYAAESVKSRHASGAAAASFSADGGTAGRSGASLVQASSADPGDHGRGELAPSRLPSCQCRSLCPRAADRASGEASGLALLTLLPTPSFRRPLTPPTVRPPAAQQQSPNCPPSSKVFMAFDRIRSRAALSASGGPPSCVRIAAQGSPDPPDSDQENSSGITLFRFSECLCVPDSTVPVQRLGNRWGAVLLRPSSALRGRCTPGTRHTGQHTPQSPLGPLLSSRAETLASTTRDPSVSVRGRPAR